MPLTFKVKDGVDHMFQKSRSGNRTFFCDMPDDKYWNPFRFAILISSAVHSLTWETLPGADVISLW